MCVSECVLAFIGLVHAASLGVNNNFTFFFSLCTHIWWPLSPFIYNCVCRFELKWFWFIFYFHWHRDTIPTWIWIPSVDIVLYRWWFSVLMVHPMQHEKRGEKKTHRDGRCCLQIPIACITCNWIAKMRCAWPKLFIPLAWHTHTHAHGRWAADAVSASWPICILDSNYSSEIAVHKFRLHGENNSN